MCPRRCVLYIDWVDVQCQSRTSSSSSGLSRMLSAGPSEPTFNDRRYLNPPIPRSKARIRPSKATIRPSKVTIRPSKAIIRPSKAAIRPSKATIRPLKVTIRLLYRMDHPYHRRNGE
ncbi:hypothetical protein B0H19DRAFT_75227 [Mycena capillaripes]|nr:hypothetical protein B0H19DRAFT_75227 [Mycena capillaripes]